MSKVNSKHLIFFTAIFALIILMGSGCAMRENDGSVSVEVDLDYKGAAELVGNVVNQVAEETMKKSGQKETEENTN